MWLYGVSACMVFGMSGCHSDAGSRATREEGDVSMTWADGRDRGVGEVMAARRRDWRCGAVVYQVFVDRFARPDEAALAAKRELYASPRRLRAWSDLPESGEKNVAAGLWSHELDFWGGDLVSLRGRLDHIEGLGAEVVYLNPIHPAHTNHKYDASDYFGVSPEYGTVADVEGLAADLHGRGMHLMLDGVFNHMGATSPRFVEAQGDPASPWRAWFEFGEAYAPGYRAWFNIPNLPEVNLESEAVQARVWGDEDSVVRGWLARGVDGWRLDVAYDIGPVLLGLKKSVHILQLGSSIREIQNMIAIAVLDAQTKANNP